MCEYDQVNMTVWLLSIGLKHVFLGYSFSHGEAALLVSGSDDKRLLLWNIFDTPSEARPLKAFFGHQNNIFGSLFDSTNQHIYS